MKKLIAMAALILATMSMMAQTQKFTAKIIGSAQADEIFWADIMAQVPNQTKAVNGEVTVSGEGKIGDIIMTRDLRGGLMGLFVVDAAELSIDMKTDVATGGEMNKELTEFMALNNGNDAQKTEKMAEMISKNKDSNLGVAMLLVGSDQLSSEQLEKLINGGGTMWKNEIGFQVMSRFETMKLRAIGSMFKELTMKDPQDKTVRLSDYMGKGKYVMVDFWASWCGPCRAEMPNVVANYEKYKDKNFEIVGVSFDNNKDAWLRSVEQLGMTWPQMSDLKGWQCEANKVYGINSIPASILFDPQGKIVAIDLRGEELGRKLAEVFK